MPHPAIPIVIRDDCTSTLVPMDASSTSTIPSAFATCILLAPNTSGAITSTMNRWRDAYAAPFPTPRPHVVRFVNYRPSRSVLGTRSQAIQGGNGQVTPTTGLSDCTGDLERQFSIQCKQQPTSGMSTPPKRAPISFFMFVVARYGCCLISHLRWQVLPGRGANASTRASHGGWGVCVVSRASCCVASCA